VVFTAPYFINKQAGSNHHTKDRLQELINIRTLKVYLETTMFNYYFDSERDAHADTVKLFEEIKAGIFQGFTSMYVLRELGDAPEDKRRKMLSLIDEYGITTFDESPEAVRLAEAYVSEKVIPSKYLTDGIHIAVATIHEMDMIVSLNFKHIVRKKTIDLTGLINVSRGYRKVEIHSPMEVVDSEY